MNDLSNRKTGLIFLVAGIFFYGWLWPVMHLGVEHLPPSGLELLGFYRGIGLNGGACFEGRIKVSYQC